MGDIGDEIGLHPLGLHLLVHRLAETGGDPPGIEVDGEENQEESRCDQEAEEACPGEEAVEEESDQQKPREIGEQEEEDAVEARSRERRGADVVFYDEEHPSEEGVFPESLCLIVSREREAERQEEEVAEKEAEGAVPVIPVLHAPGEILERGEESAAERTGGRNPEKEKEDREL